MVRITETVIRDANQSLLATRMRREDFASVLETMDKAGYYSLECWGGATFDTCLRFLQEDPWERLRLVREKMPNTKLQMLLRGQSLLGYRHYPDDVVRQFVRSSVENGIDIIRIFDALNDINNIKVALEETRLAGGFASCAMSYTSSPVHNIPYYIRLAKDYVSAGAQSVCVKDMAGLLEPEAAYALISALKESVDCPVVLHTHCTTGVAMVTCYNAIRAGVDVLDTATTAFSGGTSQPSTEVIARMIEALGQEHGLDMARVKAVDAHFQAVRQRYQAQNAIPYKVTVTNPTVLTTQIPGGMYSNLLSQIKNYDMADRMEELVQEIPAVRKDMGYPPLVTPISQMVGTQAIVNLMTGERYATVISEIKSYFSGEYGTPPGEVNRELMERIAGTREFPARRYAETLEPAIEKTVAAHPGRSMEDVLSYLLFPTQAKEFFEGQKPQDPDAYEFSQVEPPKNLESVSPDGDVVALLTAIMAYRLKKDVDKIRISRIYREKEA